MFVSAGMTNGYDHERVTAIDITLSAMADSV